MSTALLLSTGSRGDVEPMLALAMGLLSSSNSSGINEVHLFVQSDYKSLLPEHPRLIPHTLPYDVNSFMRALLPSEILNMIRKLFYEQDTFKHMHGLLATILTDLVIPSIPTVLAVAEDINPRFIACSTLMTFVAQAVSEKVDSVPVIFDFQPMTPSPHFPCILLDRSSSIRAGILAGSIPHDFLSLSSPPTQQPDALPNVDLSIDEDAIITSNRILWERAFLPCRVRLNEQRENIGLDPFSEEEMYNMYHCDIRRVAAYPKELVPSKEMLNLTQGTQCGALASEYIPPNWDPQTACPGVYKYVMDTSKPKPLCITMGSVRFNFQQRQANYLLLSALRTSARPNDRFLFLTREGGLSPDLILFDSELKAWCKDNVLVTKEHPQYSWLFPHCAAVLCHGGSGTVTAALQSGIPVGITPVVNDELFWAMCVEVRGFGSGLQRELLSSTVDEVAEVLRKVREEDVVQRARLVAESMRAVSGVYAAVQFLENVKSTK